MHLCCIAISRISIGFRAFLHRHITHSNELSNYGIVNIAILTNRWNARARELVARLVARETEEIILMVSRGSSVTDSHSTVTFATRRTTVSPSLICAMQ